MEDPHDNNMKRCRNIMVCQFLSCVGGTCDENRNRGAYAVSGGSVGMAGINGIVSGGWWNTNWIRGG